MSTVSWLWSQLRMHYLLAETPRGSHSSGKKLHQEIARPADLIMHLRSRVTKLRGATPAQMRIKRAPDAAPLASHTCIRRRRGQAGEKFLPLPPPWISRCKFRHARASWRYEPA